MTKVSLIYASAGGGHLTLARATQEALDKYYPGQFEYTYFDPFPRIYSEGYRLVNTRAPKLWGVSWHATDNTIASNLVHFFNRRRITKALVRHFTEYQPDIIITNNALVTNEIHHARDISGNKARIIVYFADPFSLHTAWLTYKEADLYLSPTQVTTESAILHGLPPDRISTVGWITRSEFLQRLPTPPTARVMLGLLPDKFTVLLSGGGQGGGKMLEICRQITSSDFLKNHSQIIVNTGKNPWLTRHITTIALKHPGIFRIIPFTEDVPLLMAASDIVVGKAGPNLLFESIQCERPFLATGCLPGQEEGNLEFIKLQQIGWVEPNSRHAVNLITHLATHPEDIKELKKNLQQVKKQHQQSSKNVAHEIHHLTKKK